MTAVTLVAALAVVVAVVAWTLAPALRRRARGAQAPVIGADRGEAGDRRDRAVRAMKELELDHRMGRLDDDDFARLWAAERAEALAALDALGAAPAGDADATRLQAVR